MGICASSKHAIDTGKNVPVNKPVETPPAASAAQPAVLTAPTVAASAAPAVVPAVLPAAPAIGQAVAVKRASMVKIYIVIHSIYHHIYKMAVAMKEGIDSVEGCEAVLYQVPETLSSEILQKMHAAPKLDLPIISSHDLPAADGLVFGFPTRFGLMTAQMKAFFDSTGGLWQQGSLVGKPATIFTSTGTQGGGQETTIMTSVTQLAHHGMIFVPPGYSAPNLMFDTDVPRGGSPWGAGCLAGADGSRQPSENELAQATNQGKYFAGKVLKLSA